MKPYLSIPDDVKKKILIILVKNVEVIERKRKIIYSIDDFDNKGDQVQYVTSKENGKNTSLDAFVRRGIKSVSVIESIQITMIRC